MRAPSSLLIALAGLVSRGFASSAAQEITQTFSAKVLVDHRSSCTLIKPVAETQLHRGIQTLSDIVQERTVRQNRINVDELTALPGDAKDQVYVEIFGASADRVTQALMAKCPGGIATDRQSQSQSSSSRTTSQQLRGASSTVQAVAPTIRKIVDSGDPANRIDVVFMGDGYTSSESTKFFSDMQRLTDDMFAGETFAQYLPLFNVWAVLQPSSVSGIGTNGVAKATTFGLYRDGTELRGIYVSKPAEARRVCALVGANACDFPSLIGNDDFYGGLGGEFVVATRSPTTGTIVLRHEMGHNFGKVGEEYDGGQVYSGANSAKSLSTITWKHWLTEPSRLVEEKAVQLYQKHIWYDLQQGAYVINFSSTGRYKRWFVQFSVSGTDTDDSLSVTLDGKPLPWKSQGVKDRSFYQWTNSTSGFSAGSHQLVIKGGAFDGSPIIKQLCNAVIYEYADETGFKMNNQDFIGVYPTFDINKAKTVRPDNERCLMRNMQSPKFCSVCQENMWLKFFARVKPIESVVVNSATKVATVSALPLAQLRSPTDPFKLKFPSLAAQEEYTVTWTKGGVEQPQFKDQFVANLATATGGASGSWSVKVKFSTPAVRLDASNLLTGTKSFTV